MKYKTILTAMYAGVNSTNNATGNAATVDNDNCSDIPEWKKVLIMKKRAGVNLNNDEHSRRNPETLPSNVNITRNGDSSSTCDNFPSGNKFSRTAKVVEQDLREISPPKTVTIGNINVELRSVKSSENPDSSSDSSKLDRTSNSDFNSTESDDNYEDLQYGPGIVDRLRARFLNLGAKKQRKPVVRRFSSLENLPGSNAGPYRVNARGIRQNGFKIGSGNYYGCGNVKKAQSMETLICSTPEQQIFSLSRRANTRYVGGVKARILAKNISPITMFTDENDEPKDKSPSPASSPRLFTKSVRRWDYTRSASAPSINEDELPKPDTVKHVKKMFETPVTANSSEKSSSHSVGARFRKIPGTVTTPTSVCNNSAILGSARPVVKKLDVAEDSPDAKTSAKESPDLSVNIPPKKEELLSPARSEESYDDFKINKRGYSPVLDDNLSANRSYDPPLAQQDTELESPNAPNLLILSPENSDTGIGVIENLSSPEESSIKVTPEQLPLEGCKHSEILSQGGRVIPISGAELLEDEDLSLPHPQPGVVSPEEGMVVAAAAASDSFSVPKKGAKWQKAPPATTSIVFDFRGKDVKPNISLNPAPFGCRPAKVSRNSNGQKKRSGSPLRSGVNGVGATSKDYEVEDEPDTEDEEEEDWDEMDIGADLPAISGIVFTGENIKIGRGAFLETRNKKLTIQFDDRATSTFEYPSENASPSPLEENGSESSPLEENGSELFDPSTAISSAANSRLGLSNYTPQVLSSNTDFELGVSQLNHKHNFPSPDKSEVIDDVPIMDVIVPAKPEDTGGWSATESIDILF